MAVPPLHVMSWNVRFAADEPPHAWPDRRPAMAAVLQAERPHLLGTQEGLPAQLVELGADLGDRYAGVGAGRNADGTGEAMHVFYDRERLECLLHGHFWLSDSPDTPGSASWGGYPRLVTWLLLVDRLSGRRVCLLNTHLEVAHADARVRSAALIESRVATIVPPGCSVVLTGDFNEPACGPVHRLLCADGPYVDTWLTGRQTTPAWGTFTDYDAPSVDGDRIDWILCSPGLGVGAVRLGPVDPTVEPPSDHLPVHAELLTS